MKTVEFTSADMTLGSAGTGVGENNFDFTFDPNLVTGAAVATADVDSGSKLDQDKDTCTFLFSVILSLIISIYLFHI